MLETSQVILLAMVVLEHVADIVWRCRYCVHGRYHAGKWAAACIRSIVTKQAKEPHLTYHAAVSVPMMNTRGDLVSYPIAPHTSMPS